MLASRPCLSPPSSSPSPHPRREVFDDADGEIKRLEDAAAADPTHKIDLIRHLQVRGRVGLGARKGWTRGQKGGSEGSCPPCQYAVPAGSKGSFGGREEAGGSGLGRERGGELPSAARSSVLLPPPAAEGLFRSHGGTFPLPLSSCVGALLRSQGGTSPPPSPWQERCSEVKAELREVLGRHGIKQHRMVPVKRNYAFEVEGVPHGEQHCIKVWTGRMCGGA